MMGHLYRGLPWMEINNCYKWNVFCRETAILWMPKRENRIVKNAKGLSSLVEPR